MSIVLAVFFVAVTAVGVAPTATAALPAVVAAPGECFDYSAAQAKANRWQLPMAPVPCEGPHTALTLAVFPSASWTTLPAAGKPSKAASDRIAAGSVRDRMTCVNELTQYLGTGQYTQFQPVLTYQQATDGAVQARCDVILWNVNQKTYLPLPSDVPAALDADPIAFQLCGKLNAEGGFGGFSPCTAKTARATWWGFLNPKGTKRFPGTLAAKRLAYRDCEASITPFYGAPNTAALWNAGGEYYCFEISP